MSNAAQLYRFCLSSIRLLHTCTTRNSLSNLRYFSMLSKLQLVLPTALPSTSADQLPTPQPPARLKPRTPKQTRQHPFGHRRASRALQGRPGRSLAAGPWLTELRPGCPPGTGSPGSSPRQRGQAGRSRAAPGPRPSPGLDALTPAEAPPRLPPGQPDPGQLRAAPLTFSCSFRTSTACRCCASSELCSRRHREAWPRAASPSPAAIPRSPGPALPASAPAARAAPPRLPGPGLRRPRGGRRRGRQRFGCGHRSEAPRAAGREWAELRPRLHRQGLTAAGRGGWTRRRRCWAESFSELSQRKQSLQIAVSRSWLLPVISQFQLRLVFLTWQLRVSRQSPSVQWEPKWWGGFTAMNS